MLSSPADVVTAVDVDGAKYVVVDVVGEMIIVHWDPLSAVTKKSESR